MGIIELLLLALGLSMDAFAVSVCKGLATKKLKLKHAIICGVWFGGFQGLMPFIGYVLGTSFASYITNIAPWIAFILLSLIGANMIKESLEKEYEELYNLSPVVKNLRRDADQVNAFFINYPESIDE